MSAQTFFFPGHTLPKVSKSVPANSSWLTGYMEIFAVNLGVSKVWASPNLAKLSYRHPLCAEGQEEAGPET